MNGLARMLTTSVFLLVLNIVLDFLKVRVLYREKFVLFVLSRGQTLGGISCVL